MKKRILAALLLVTLLLTMLPVNVLAEDIDVPAEDIEAPENDSGTLTEEDSAPEEDSGASAETTAASVSLPDGCPIVIGYAYIDYGADLILSQLKLDGLSDEKKIQTVYDWVIRNCARTGDGGDYYDPDDYASEIEAYGKDVIARINSGTAVMRKDLVGKDWDGNSLDGYLYTGEISYYDSIFDKSSYVASAAYSMMCTRVGDCADYTSLLTVLLGHLGYDSRVISGDFINSDGEHVMHKWSCVLVNGKYYWLDVRMDHSWYQSLGYIPHKFFMRTNLAEWKQWHDWDSDYSDWLFANAGTVQSYILPTKSWKQVSGSWYYYVNGTPATGWQKVDGKWYYLNPTTGAMLTGWQKVDGSWYYLNNAMQTGWQKISGSWYYLNNAMQTGWQKIDGKWYYLGTNGAMQTGWQKINGSWYYLNTAMTTGWQKIDGSWYWFGTNGAMKTGWQKIDGKWYYLNNAMRTGWQKIDGSWYWFGTNGTMKTGWQKIDGKWYYLNNAMRTGWQKIDSVWYYFGTDGAMVSDCTLNIDGTDYTFSENGAWVS